MSYRDIKSEIIKNYFKKELAMGKTPAQLEANRLYYNNKLKEGYTQLNVLVKKDIVSILKDYANKNDLSIQKALSSVLKKGLNIKNQSSWD